MEKYEVKIFSTAKQDLLEIIDYLNTLSPETALRYYDKLTEEIGGLSHMPERCPRPRDLALAAKGYRYLIVENYLVFYTISVHRVLSPRFLLGGGKYQNFLLFCVAGTDLAFPAACYPPVMRVRISFVKVITMPPAMVRIPLERWEGSWDWRERPTWRMP